MFELQDAELVVVYERSGQLDAAEVDGDVVLTVVVDSAMVVSLFS